ncbi:DNA methyltransferase [Actinomadura sp. 7K507]|uniref:DNA methyltransferase n=1 Tax=Actinomadura sp. 7K507 TaxID=2530365 RepID=UPI001046AC51|nr:DNA methyltransferase [Actinomadura sp. 7K507]TDC89583.1 hypothetical protein E1285_16265 [Actinomadura sp. 7K507]
MADPAETALLKLGRRYRRGDLTAGKHGKDVDFEWKGVRPKKGRHWAYSREKLNQTFTEGRIEFRSTGMPVYKRYLGEQPGVALQDIWSDIRLTSSDKERLGYPTQKRLGLLERILVASTNPGDVVLDPFRMIRRCHPDTDRLKGELTPHPCLG